MPEGQCVDVHVLMHSGHNRELDVSVSVPWPALCMSLTTTWNSSRDDTFGATTADVVAVGGIVGDRRVCFTKCESVHPNPSWRRAVESRGGLGIVVRAP